MLGVYEECGIRPVDITYVEAHGTGTKAGDPEEVNSIADVFCKGRQSPLLIGSTKSNMGHPEPASGKFSFSCVKHFISTCLCNLEFKIMIIRGCQKFAQAVCILCINNNFPKYQETT